MAALSRPASSGAPPAIALALVLLVLLAAATLSRVVARESAEAPASPAAVAASLARGTAWIWPDSDGPRTPREAASAPYRQAAAMVASLVLRGRIVERASRTAPLSLPPGVKLVPVVHVESSPDAPDDFTPSQRDAVLDALRRHAGEAAAGAGLLQLDFEAPLRQRPAYRALLAQARAELPAEVRLSVTALVHWCAQGRWLDRLPVDEVVPMLYRLGPRADDWRRRFARDDPSLARRCRGPALGFATDEPPPAALLERIARPWWFDGSAWSNPSRP